VAKQASKQKLDNSKSIVIKGLIALSIALNILFIVGALAVTSFIKSGRSTASILNYFISSKLDYRGCIPSGSADVDAELVSKYGEDVSVCVRTTMESPDGTIQWPENLKGEKYLPEQ
jgi:hypothetical protein